MKINKLFFGIICMSILSCCKKEEIVVIEHLSPNIKKSLPYEDGQVLIFVDSASNKNIEVKCNTKSEFFTIHGCKYTGGCVCKNTEFENYTIELNSLDSTIKVNLKFVSNVIIGSSAQASKPLSISLNRANDKGSVDLAVNDSGKFSCMGSDSLPCSENQKVENLPYKNLFELTSEYLTFKGIVDTTNYIKKVWLNNEKGIVKLTYRNGKTYYLQP